MRYIYLIQQETYSYSGMTFIQGFFDNEELAIEAAKELALADISKTWDWCIYKVPINAFGSKIDDALE